MVMGLSTNASSRFFLISMFYIIHGLVLFSVQCYWVLKLFKFFLENESWNMAYQMMNFWNDWKTVLMVKCHSKEFGFQSVWQKKNRFFDEITTKIRNWFSWIHHHPMARCFHFNYHQFIRFYPVIKIKTQKK